MSNPQDLIEDIKKEFITILGPYNNNGVQIQDNRHMLFLHSLLETSKISPSNGLRPTFINNLVKLYFNTKNNDWEVVNVKDATGITQPSSIVFSGINYQSSGVDVTSELPIYIYTISTTLKTVPPNTAVPVNIKNAFTQILYNLIELNNYINSQRSLVSTEKSVKRNIEILLNSLFKIITPPPVAGGAGPLVPTPISFTNTAILPYNNLLENLINDINSNSKLLVFNNNIYADLVINLRLTRLTGVGSLDFTKVPNFINSVVELFHKLIFTTKTSKYLVRNLNIDQLLTLNKKKASNIIDAMEEYFNNTNSELVNNRDYYRKKENPDILYTKNRLNKEVDVLDPTYENDRTRLIPPDVCMGVNGLGLNPGKCADYLDKCISGTDINGCKEFMTNKSFWSDDNNPNSAKNNVINMSPKEAELTLNKLLFRKVNNKIDNNIKEYESVVSWLKNLNSNPSINQKEYDSIVANTNLLHFLNLLVAKINNNPDILNTNLVRKLKSEVIFENSKNQMANIKYVYYPTKIANRQTQISSILRRIESMKYMNRNILPYTNFRGGANNTDISPNNIESYLKNLNMPDTLFISFTFQQIFNDIMTVLKNHNKTISHDDLVKINNLIEKMKRNEKTLLAIQFTLQEYIASVEGNITPESNTFDEIVNIVSSHNNKINNYFTKTNSIKDILGKFAEHLHILNGKV